jgi:hypothetical protein
LVLNALVFGIFHVAILVIVGVVLWRVFLALCRKYAIGRNIGIAVAVLGSLLLSGLVFRTMVQYTLLAVELLRQRQEGDASFQAHREEFREKGLYLSLEDLEKLQELCPPDRIIELRVGAKSFYLPWRWIRGQHTLARSVWASTSGAACPVDPVQSDQLFLFPPDPEIARERDLNLFFIKLRLDEWSSGHPRVPLSNPASRITYSDGSYLEDVTDAWRARNNNPLYVKDDFRAYLLQQAAAVDRTHATPIEMTCTTLDAKTETRSCSAHFQYDDLTAEYTYYPKRSRRTSLDEILHLPDGPIETDGFLPFDARVRKWIDDIQKKP